MSNVNIEIFNIAYEYLKCIADEIGVGLEKYFIPNNSDAKSIEDVFLRFIISAQNYQAFPRIIKFDEREEEIRDILHNYDLSVIKRMDYDYLYQIFRKRFNVTSADTKMNTWYKWSRSIIDSAKFLSDFDTYEDFNDFVLLFSKEERTSIALPLLLSTKIHGIGFALSCDTLKELGYVDYPKPDVHLNEVFSEIGLSDGSDYSTFDAVRQMAKDVNKSSYIVDKIFWLICSGYYYLEEPKIRTKSHKKEIIKIINSKIEKAIPID